MENLGKLEKVNDIRKVWPDEARNFTCWLAKEENLAILSDEIGLTLELIERESPVGSFNVDIFAKVQDTEQKVIIENQLEQSDHDHLGKVLTYASNKDAEILIWIVKRARQEHQRAIEWLNQHTDDKISVFMIEIELWKIGDSKLAPRFNIVVQPDAWDKIQRSTDPATGSQLFCMEFWNEFQDYASSDSVFSQYYTRLRKPSKQNAQDMPFGNPDLWTFAKFDTRKNTITCGIYIPYSKKHYEQIKNSQQIIDKYFPTEKEDIIKDEKEGRQSTYITISKDNCDVSSHDSKQRGEYFKWICDNAVKWKKVIDEIIK